VVGVEKKCQRGAVGACRRFHDMRDEPLFGLRIEIRKILA